MWLRDGDHNSTFFHSSMKDRFRRNFINVIESPSGRVEGVKYVKEDVMSDFENFFKETNNTRPVPEGIIFKCIIDEDNRSLKEPFSASDIKEAI